MIIKKIILKIFRELIILFTKQIQNRIVLVQESNSGSNTLAFWKYLKKNKSSKKLEFIIFSDGLHDSIYSYYKKFKLLSSGKVIVTTHDSYKLSSNHIHIQLWHGLPLRKGKTYRKVEKAWKNVDTIVSSSSMYNQFLNSLYLTDFSKYKILGFPRNDLLFYDKGLDILQKIFKQKFSKKEKIIFYMPTLRENSSSLNSDYNYDFLFGFSSFDFKSFDSFLGKNDIKMILKCHPHEEYRVSKYFMNFKSKNILILTNTHLVKFNVDLYEIIGSSSMLITDYSSVFYDYLLLDKPILFLPSDYDSYNKKIGFLVDDYKTWVPGPVVSDSDSLKKEIIKLFEDSNYYLVKRNLMKKNIHKYIDAKSSERLLNYIYDIVCVE